MSLTSTQLDKLSKADLIAYTLDVQTKYNENLNICEKLEKALEDIAALQKTVNELRQQNIELESSISITKNVNDHLLSRIESLERQTNANAQYSRRECLEISGVPASIEDDDLEDKVIEILSTINVTVDSSQIEACHRLKNDRTIIKFCSRKTCHNVLKNRKKLKDLDKTTLGMKEDDKIFINESLCPEYRFLLWKCRKLCEANKIVSYWTFNGTVKIKISEQGRIHAITHVKDLKDLFSDFDFSK